MSTPAKVLLGIFTLAPMFFGVWLLIDYIVLIKEMMLSLPLDAADQHEFMRNYMAHIFSGQFIIVCILAVVSHFALMIYYIVHVVSHKLKSEGEKVMWILLFIFVGTIAFIIYFFLRIVPAAPQRNNDLQPGGNSF